MSADASAPDSTTRADSTAAAAGAAPPPMLLLSESTVINSVTMSDAIYINAQAFLAVAATSQTQVPAYASIHTTAQSQSQSQSQPNPPAPSDATLFKPALLDEALGLKVVAVRPGNEHLSLPTVPAVILLNDRATGFPIALVQATYLTALRTAAGSGVATDCFARADASVLAVLGAGMQAEQHVHAMLCVRRIQTVHIMNRTTGRAQQLVARLQPSYPDVQFYVHAYSDPSFAGAVRSAHVVCTTTNSSVPLVRLEHVAPGTHINAIGSYQTHMHELEAELVAKCRITIDTPAALHAGDLHTCIERGLIRAEEIEEIGRFIDRSKYARPLRSSESDRADPIGFQLHTESAAPAQALRTSADDRTLFKSVGSAIQDVATAYAVLQRARQQKLGKQAEWE